MVDSAYRTLAFNRRMFDNFSLPPGTLHIGMDFRDVLQIWAQYTGQDDAMLEQATRRLDSREPYSVEYPQEIQGQLRWCQLTHTPLPNGGFVRTFTDTTERKRLEQELDRLSRIDSLTGAMMRRAFNERLAEEMERAWRLNHPLTLLIADLDHFKQVNDTRGHHAGDVALRNFVAVCQEEFRKYDLVGRLGGEEFALLLPDTGIDAARLWRNGCVRPWPDALSTLVLQKQFFTSPSVLVLRNCALRTTPTSLSKERIGRCTRLREPGATACSVKSRRPATHRSNVGCVYPKGIRLPTIFNML